MYYLPRSGLERDIEDMFLLFWIFYWLQRDEQVQQSLLDYPMWV